MAGALRTIGAVGVSDQPSNDFFAVAVQDVQRRFPDAREDRQVKGVYFRLLVRVRRRNALLLRPLGLLADNALVHELHVLAHAVHCGDNRGGVGCLISLRDGALPD